MSPMTIGCGTRPGSALSHDGAHGSGRTLAGTAACGPAGGGAGKGRWLWTSGRTRRTARAGLEAASSFFKVALFLLSAVGLGASGGCDGEATNAARLTGEVTLDGQPLPASALASVSFRPIDTGGARATSAQIVDGRYECPNVPQGKVLAYMNISIPTGRTYSTGPKGKTEEELETIRLVREQEQGIEIDVTGNGTVNFDLKRANQRATATR